MAQMELWEAFRHMMLAPQGQVRDVGQVRQTMETGSVLRWSEGEVHPLPLHSIVMHVKLLSRPSR